MTGRILSYVPGDWYDVASCVITLLGRTIITVCVALIGLAALSTRHAKEATLISKLSPSTS